MLRLPPLALYVHIPWCVRKCPYCDFNSHRAPDALPEASYVDALLRDLDNERENAQGRQLVSIFFGGGTPSLFSDKAIGRILDHAEESIGFSPDIEITLEANPGTVEQGRFQGYRAAGVNRLSIGIQSFNDRHLRNLGRIHDSSAALNAAQSARRAGFDNFNLDLMHGLPEQTPDEALADLELAAQMAPAHLSWYQLTIEPNTEFHTRPPTLPEEDILDTIQERGAEFLAGKGYRQYEVSAYAREGKASRHNLNYWQFGDYLGIGAGAHGKITFPDSGEIVRCSKTRIPNDYLAREEHHLASRQVIGKEELPLEFLMNALRLVEGVPEYFYRERTGLDPAAISERWHELVRLGLLREPGPRLATTEKGLRFLNPVLGKFS